MTGSPYDPALSAVLTAADLAAWVAIWEARGEAPAGAHARRCAADAMNAIDAMLGELHGIRARLIPEIRTSDDAAAARTQRAPADAVLVRRLPALCCRLPAAEKMRNVRDLGPWTG